VCNEAEWLCREGGGVLGEDVAANPRIDTAGTEIETRQDE
jgi:hypothetical protein